MSYVTTTDGTEIFSKDWGDGRPVVLSHGRSTQTWSGNDMDHYAGPFFGANREGVTVSPGIHGDDDQVVPFSVGGRASAALVTDATLTVYESAPHGITDTHKDRLGQDLLDFLKG